MAQWHFFDLARKQKVLTTRLTLLDLYQLYVLIFDIIFSKFYLLFKSLMLHGNTWLWPRPNTLPVQLVLHEIHIGFIQILRAHTYCEGQTFFFKILKKQISWVFLINQIKYKLKSKWINASGHWIGIFCARCNYMKFWSLY